MLSLLISILYLIIVIIYVIASFFIVYHLIRYSNGSELKTAMLILFVVIASGLLLSNLLLFYSINWNSILAQLTF
jgi:hypothetical protein